MKMRTPLISLLLVALLAGCSTEGEKKLDKLQGGWDVREIDNFPDHLVFERDSVTRAYYNDEAACWTFEKKPLMVTENNVLADPASVESQRQIKFEARSGKLFFSSQGGELAVASRRDQELELNLGPECFDWDNVTPLSMEEIKGFWKHPSGRRYESITDSGKSLVEFADGECDRKADFPFSKVGPNRFKTTVSKWDYALNRDTLYKSYWNERKTERLVRLSQTEVEMVKQCIEMDPEW